MVVVHDAVVQCTKINCKTETEIIFMFDMKDISPHVFLLVFCFGNKMKDIEGALYDNLSEAKKCNII